MESNDKKLEAFVDKLMANTVLEQPSVDFTSQVLKRLEVKSKTITYKPLIPKWVWAIIATAILLIVVYTPFNSEGANTSSRLLELLNLTQVEFKPLKNFDFYFSKTLLYSVVAFSVMVGLQVPLLKSYLNRQMQF